MHELNIAAIITSIFSKTYNSVIFCLFILFLEKFMFTLHKDGKPSTASSFKETNCMECKLYTLKFEKFKKLVLVQETNEDS